MQSTAEHPYVSKWYFFLFALPKKKPHSFHQGKHFGHNTIAFLETAFSRWNVLLTRSLTDPFPFFLSAGISHWQEKHLHRTEKNLWPPRTLGPTQKALEGVKLMSSSSVFPGRCSTSGCRVSPQQLMTVKHLHGSCCACPSDRSC